MVESTDREVEVHYGIMELKEKGLVFRGKVEWIKPRLEVTEVNIYA